MTFTYDPTTDLGKVRLLLTDTSDTAPLPYFQDNEVQAFLDIENNNIKLAAARGLIVLASNEALVQKKVEMSGPGISLDGPAVSDALRKLAKELKDSALADMSIDWAEVVVNGPQADEKSLIEYLRDN